MIMVNINCQYRDITYHSNALTIIVCTYCWKLEKDIIKAKSRTD